MSLLSGLFPLAIVLLLFCWASLALADPLPEAMSLFDSALAYSVVSSPQVTQVETAASASSGGTVTGKAEVENTITTTAGHLRSAATSETLEASGPLFLTMNWYPSLNDSTCLLAPPVIVSFQVATCIPLASGSAKYTVSPRSAGKSTVYKSTYSDGQCSTLASQTTYAGITYAGAAAAPCVAGAGSSGSFSAKTFLQSSTPTYVSPYSAIKVYNSARNCRSTAKTVVPLFYYIAVVNKCVPYSSQSYSFIFSCKGTTINYDIYAALNCSDSPVDHTGVSSATALCGQITPWSGVTGYLKITC